MLFGEGGKEREGKMLTCIACSKQLNNNNGSIGSQQDEDALETPRTRQAIKALTSQVLLLDIIYKYRNLHPCENAGKGD